MFDDPKKYLSDLDSRLRAEKYEEELEKLVESPDDFDLDAILGEEEEPPLEQWFHQDLTEDIPIRNHANGYGTRPYPGQIPQSPYQSPQTRSQTPQTPYQAQQAWAQAAQPRPQASRPQPTQPRAKAPRPQPSRASARPTQAVKRVSEVRELEEKNAVLDERPRKKGVGGLWLLLLLEIAGILAVALWWLRYLL